MAVVEIPLTQGKVATIDEADLPIVSGKKWRVKKTAKSRTLYAVTHGNGSIVSMHRLILGITDPSMIVDHRDCNGLNNCRSNLRTATPSDNARNRGKWWGRSRFLGVTHTRVKSKPWRAMIRVGRKLVHLGYFASEEEAARCYDTAARHYFGGFAHPNFPVE